ncbi:multidrug efflux SMR transporter [Vagococcus lutrae]|uniref:DMT family transporter n=1 Tax=Vagococcus lutrae TaxID=81947 RepID=UPI000F88EA40|nr:multidrug efflux SMR transporter [Vagococcus lutrae]MCO7150353.1 multidrug efflux SMR transporter [Vagococcus lutrae]MDT2806661.1 multidrug efflux SMR transporter [Vagococcus lutrae]MDT2811793.1 multidrug efflux SMR transporter [Vagococcus lutrae]MDT2817842.1 multidrug efflux SMR transporter [Vagococcus lutrae]MDT2818752.1 multidrug efflux SMR transporter [Vagococcus lutrae]
MRYWVQVVIAGLFEVVWVIGLKHASSPIEWGVTLVAIFLSFYWMIEAGNHLPVGTVYAVFVGIGTTGTVLLEALLFKQPLSFVRIMFIVMLLIGVVGLKLVTPTEKGID